MDTMKTTETKQTKAAVPSRKHLIPQALAGVFFLISAIVGAIMWLPSFTVVPEPDPAEPALVIGGEVMNRPARVDGGVAYIPLDVIREQLDPTLVWDAARDIISISTSDKLIQLQTAGLTGFVNLKPVNLEFPLIVVDRVPYLPSDILEQVYPVRIGISSDSRVVTVDQADQPVIAGKAVGTAVIRLTPTRKAPKVAHLKDGETLKVYREDQGWLLVRTEAGRAGYVPKSGVTITGVIPGEGRKSPTFRSWTPLGDRINLVWEYVGNRTPKTIDIPKMPGLNVVSPTWFHVIDNDGNVSNAADRAYVRWAAERGYQVWGLVTNGFDRDRTKAVLSDPAKREKIVRQLLNYAALYDLDGINIDFENLYPEDKGLLVQFVRELTPLAHEAGLVVSIDVTIKSQSKYWSLPYDRKVLGAIVDYVALMAYDENSKNGGKAGSVASLPWVEKGVKSLLEEVPAEKILLGVPFYTRLWTEEKKPDGTVEVTARAVSMDAAREWVKETGVPLTWDEAAGQAYAEKADGNNVTKVWLEDEKSMAARVELVRKYNLAGLAAWRRGFEEEAIWTTINVGMQKGPR